VGRMSSVVFGSSVVEVSFFGCPRSGARCAEGLGSKVLPIFGSMVSEVLDAECSCSRLRSQRDLRTATTKVLHRRRRRFGVDVQLVFGLVVLKSWTRGVEGAGSETSNGSIRLETSEVFGSRSSRSVPGCCAERLRA
jgi:hypothetical protein